MKKEGKQGVVEQWIFLLWLDKDTVFGPINQIQWKQKSWTEFSKRPGWHRQP
jgi:hypothetical protein